MNSNRDTTTEIIQAVKRYQKSHDISELRKFTTQEYDSALVEYSKYCAGSDYAALRDVVNIIKEERSSALSNKLTWTIFWLSTIFSLVIGYVVGKTT